MQQHRAWHRLGAHWMWVKSLEPSSHLLPSSAQSLSPSASLLFGAAHVGVLCFARAAGSTAPACPELLAAGICLQMMSFAVLHESHEDVLRRTAVV